MWTIYGDVKVQTSPATAITLSALHNTTNLEKIWTNNGDAGYWGQSGYKMNQVALGLNTQLAPKWNLIVEGVTNNVDKMEKDTHGINKNGLWTRVTYGNLVWNKANTWHVYGEYFALGNASMDSIGWGHHLNIQGGNADQESWGHGARGWGIGVGYQLARNTNLELTYYMLKPYDEAAAGFEKYQNVGYAALSYSF